MAETTGCELVFESACGKESMCVNVVQAEREDVLCGRYVFVGNRISHPCCKSVNHMNMPTMSRPDAFITNPIEQARLINSVDNLIVIGTNH